MLFRCRVDKPLLTKANRITRKLGTSTPEMVRVFLAEIARTGRVPVNLQAKADDRLVGSWEQRATMIESFYGKSKAW